METTDAADSLSATEAVGRAYRAYEGKLRSAALRITGNAADADDALQDGLLNALRGARSFDHRSEMTSWLYSVVTNAARMCRRRDGRRARLRQSVAASIGPTDEREEGSQGDNLRRDTVAYLEAREALARAGAALREFDDDTRAVLELTAQGETTADIASACGESVAAVKSRVWRARVKIRATATGQGG